MFTHYNDNGKKEATYQRLPFDWEAHLKGEKYLGLSPVKITQNGTGRKGVCRWIAWDLDVEATPEDFVELFLKLILNSFVIKLPVIDGTYTII